jgi:putative salt-induced outer membrane protein YdiY
MHRVGMALLVFATIVAGSLRADVVTLKNGDRISGAIVKSDAKVLVIKSEFAGDVSVQWDAIASIESTQPLHVGLTGGQMIVGPVTSNDGKVQVATQAAGSVTTSKDSIQVIRSDSEQAAYDAQMDRLQHPHLSDFWTGLLDTGLSVTRGNSATLNFTLAAKAIRATPRDKITIYSAAVYGVDDGVSPSRTTAHEIKGGIRVDVNVSDRWFVFGLTDFDTNELQHLDLQNVTAGGVGYHVVKTKNTTFDIFAGAGYNQQYFSSYMLANATPPPLFNSFAAVTQRNGTALVGEELDTKLNSRTTFVENFTYYPGVGSNAGYRFTFNASSATKVKNWLGFQVTFSDNYISNPPFGIKGNDLLLSTGLRATFGKGLL